MLKSPWEFYVSYSYVAIENIFNKQNKIKQKPLGTQKEVNKNSL